VPNPRDLPHLFLSSAPDSPRFTSPRAGGGKTRTKLQDREIHGRRLSEQYWTAVKETAGKSDTGIRLEFESEPGFDLHLKSLDPDGKRGFELLNVRTDRDGEVEVVKATVLVEQARLSHFEKLFQDYLTKTRGKAGQPANRLLVESIANVRRAHLKSLWTDSNHPFPPWNERRWWEVWLRNKPGAVDSFRNLAANRGLLTSKRSLEFIDRLVLNVQGSAGDLSKLLREDDLIAELRAPTISTSEFIDLSGAGQREFADDLVERLEHAGDASPAVCVLDTGVARAHRLISPALPQHSWLSVDPSRWQPDDTHGHGTQMAGLALLGDLGPILSSNEPVKLIHGLESVKLFPRPGNTHSHEAYGAVTIEAVSRVEVAAPFRPRVICMAVTSTEHMERGRPTSWSSAVDKLACGEGDSDGPRRLFCISAGNMDPSHFHGFPTTNELASVEDPAQAWNVLTIGAFADRETIDEPALKGWTAVAKVGELCPSSTTSVMWDDIWPIKPELVLPGGNAALDPAGLQTDFPESLCLLTTHHQPVQKQLAATGDTSAATALAARMAARVQAKYPHLWPETVRGLLVHSAEWTPAMQAYLPTAKLGPRKKPKKIELERRLLRIFGYGTPNEVAAMYSGKDALTLIRQDELQPYDRNGSRFTTKDMHFYSLPWPSDELKRLGETEVELRVTISYFIEPLPGERGYALNQRHRYASHGLRFEMKTGAETVDQFKVRINKAVREDGEKATSIGDSKNWVLGPDLRSKGSLHSDRWFGPAVELAAKDCLAVYPVVGWWRERPRFDRWSSRARYALIVSIRAPKVEADIYTPVAIRLGVPVAVTS